LVSGGSGKKLKINLLLGHNVDPAFLCLCPKEEKKYRKTIAQLTLSRGGGLDNYVRFEGQCVAFRKGVKVTLN
jgi:hypothetical protein